MHTRIPLTGRRDKWGEAMATSAKRITCADLSFDADLLLRRRRSRERERERERLRLLDSVRSCLSCLLSCLRPSSFSRAAFFCFFFSFLACFLSFCTRQRPSENSTALDKSVTHLQHFFLRFYRRSFRHILHAWSQNVLNWHILACICPRVLASALHARL